MRIATALLFFLVPLSAGTAEQVTSTTSVLTDDLIVDMPGDTSIKLKGTNAFDFSGDGVADQQLNYKLVVETSDGNPLTPVFENGIQTGDLDLDSNLSPLVITYAVEGMTELPGADPAFNYSFVSADFLGVEITVDRGGTLIFADASAETNFEDPSTTIQFDLEKNGHWAAGGIEMKNGYILKASPEVGTQVLHSLTHSRFTVDVTAVPEPGVAGAIFALAIGMVIRRRK